ncbi:thiamine phosphate synthase [Haloferax sp. DFSO60]|uniref:thiamine phosphate synthase n=1 Tax=Haloferax sp. DFSO60 TaxID=3388652 RepID=UPI00397855E0
MNISVDTYLVTQSDLSGGRTSVEVVEAALRGGIDVIQLREKHASARTRYELGQAIRELTANEDVLFVVNDRVDIAVAVDADGVHLGDDDVPIDVAREQLADDALIGRSVSTVEGAKEAESAGADYLGVGAVFETSSKDTKAEQSEIGLKRVEDIADTVSIPIVGIGGITPDNATDVVAAGADGVAVISAITAAPNPADATRQLATAVSKGRVVQ